MKVPLIVNFSNVILEDFHKFPCGHDPAKTAKTLGTPHNRSYSMSSLIKLQSGIGSK